MGKGLPVAVGLSCLVTVGSGTAAVREEQSERVMGSRDHVDISILYDTPERFPGPNP